MFCIKPSKKRPEIEDYVGSKRRRLTEKEEDQRMINELKETDERIIG